MTLRLSLSQPSCSRARLTKLSMRAWIGASQSRRLACPRSRQPKPKASFSSQASLRLRSGRGAASTSPARARAACVLHQQRREVSQRAACASDCARVFAGSHGLDCRARAAGEDLARPWPRTELPRTRHPPSARRRFRSRRLATDRGHARHLSVSRRQNAGRWRGLGASGVRALRL